MDAKERAAERRKKILAKQKDRLAIASGNPEHLDSSTSAVQTTELFEGAAAGAPAKAPVQNVPTENSEVYGRQLAGQPYTEVTAPVAAAENAPNRQSEARDSSLAGFPVHEPTEQNKDAIKTPSVPAWARICALAAIAAFFVLAWVPSETARLVSSKRVSSACFCELQICVRSDFNASPLYGCYIELGIAGASLHCVGDRGVYAGCDNGAAEKNPKSVDAAACPQEGHYVTLP